MHRRPVLSALLCAVLYLFTADASKPFTVLKGDGLVEQFDVVTVWEFLEHIKREDLPGVIENIKRHLKPGGLLIGTINTLQGKMGYQQTVMTPIDWITLFEQNGFEYAKDVWNYIYPDWVRVCDGSSA